MCPATPVRRVEGEANRPMKVLLSPWQFGVTITYHFLFVPLTIGLALLVAVMQVLAYVKKDETWGRLSRFFGTLFLINFAMGVVTGIVQEFQFGMNWSNYSVFVGNIFGAPLAMEGLLAFFAESTFIGLWLSGRNRLPALVHTLSICMVSLATIVSAFFILAANAWDPDHRRHGRAEPVARADPGPAGLEPRAAGPGRELADLRIRGPGQGREAGEHGQGGDSQPDHRIPRGRAAGALPLRAHPAGREHPGGALPDDQPAGQGPAAGQGPHARAPVPAVGARRHRADQGGSRPRRLAARLGRHLLLLRPRPVRRGTAAAPGTRAGHAGRA